MKDAGSAKLGEFVEFKSYRPTCETQLRCNISDMLERRSFQRNIEAAPQARDVGDVTVPTGNHCEAGKAALRGLGLKHNRDAGP